MMGDQIQSLPSHATLCGIGFDISVHEGLIVFEESICIWGCHERMFFERADGSGAGCWQFGFSTSRGRISASHIVAAYDLVQSVYGKNFECKKAL